jgi:hypothetical protein
MGFFAEGMSRPGYPLPFCMRGVDREVIIVANLVAAANCVEKELWAIVFARRELSG